MKSSKFIFLFATIILAHLAGYSQVFDDFSDGDFTNSPTWTGNVAVFVIEDEVLRSNSPGAADYYLSTPNAFMDDVQWEFYIKLAFSTSGSNYADVYLVADNSDLTAVQNGYFIRIGGTPDEISLFKRSAGANTIIIDGEDGIVNSSSNNIFDLRVTRTSDGEWSVFYDKNQTGTFVSGGTVVDNEITSTTDFGVFIEQASSPTFVNKHFFDNFSVAPIPVDETPPVIIGGVANSSTEFELSFSEALDQTTAEDAGNYQLNGVFSTVSAAELSGTDPTIVTLTIDNPIPNGTVVPVHVTNVEDLAGNPMGTQTIDILYFTPDASNYKDVVFNELFADPTPVIGLPDGEYLEIFNASDGIFDLANWTLVNSTTAKTLTSAVLFPGEFVILCDAANAELFEQYGTVIGIPSFTALSNAADSLTLLNPQGVIIDIVSYTDSWYNDPVKKDGGYSIELINPYTECSGKNNWSGSNNETGGTPGAQNSIFDETPDTSSPSISSFQLITNQVLQINFSESMDATSLVNGSYSWNEGIENAGITVLPNFEAVQVELNMPLETGVSYILSISNITDCSGNLIAQNTTIEIFLGQQPEEYDLLISEIMADPSPSVGLPEGEYFELYNASDKILEIAGIRLNDKVFSESRILLPGAYLLCIDEDLALDFINYPDAYILTDLGTTYFTNGGRDLSLYNANNEEIDRANYRMDWYRDTDKQDGGYSLERINLEEPCRAGANWKASIDPQGGTPEAENSVIDNTPDTSPPKAITIFVQDSTQIQIRFSETIDELSVIMAAISIIPELSILSVEAIAPDYNAINIQLAENIQAAITYSVSLSGIADCVSNESMETETLYFGLPQEATPGDLLINEVLFYPQTGGSDFVEVVNVSDKIISLQNWALQNQSATTREITPNPVLIFPDEYIVFTASPSNIAQEYPFGKPENYFKMDVPSYNNGSGSVILLDADENVIDQFDYLESYHFSLLNTFKGVSLERMNFSSPTNDSGNWTSAAETVGFATPGYLNSQYSVEGTARTNFEFDNEIFSPDNDGYQDILNLNYKLEAPGYVATIEIYDRRGRLLKTLENNLLLATSGTISWNGVTDDGMKARIGPHIYVITLFNLEGNTETIKLPCIVAGRLSN
ncbi:hypothetical protein G3O08_00870 [Cryomorpha ignava]|uniref:LTD domain-containing protein n=1 Tax=Cryomorpha ignava TaxID=101383 RepID=A0A7K3WMX8_9FLAO|nr:lamin tail domain-containing protein [Cryomorpha ignava]NEN22055.1 hypothetical protein [Cryomorpha ignava]